jgi:type III pantothenate kinase
LELTIDIGNTRVKAATFLNDEVQQLYFFDFENKAKWQVIKNLNPSSVIMSSVKGHSFSFPHRWSNIRCLNFDHNTNIPIVNKYATPVTLGLDRLASAVGAFHLFPTKNVMIIDCGTCITYDILNRDGDFIGGSISPGLKMRYRSLHQNTGSLPEIEHKEFPHLTGNSTESSILSGVQNGIIFEINGFIAAYQEQYSNLQVVLCGGDTTHFANRLKNEIFAAPNLVLLGLHQILKYNDK